MKIIIVDYGIGNVFSVCSALKTLGLDYELTSDHQKILSADKIILPGVGAFQKAMDNLISSGLDEVLREYVKKGNFFLGICVGMQVLLSTGEEGGNHRGLDLIPGRVEHINKSQLAESNLKIPHISWSNINLIQCPDQYSFIKDFSTNRTDLMYFVHSFHSVPLKSNNLVATCDYSELILGAVIADENILGTQFHPEKSGKVGLSFLSKWSSL